MNTQIEEIISSGKAKIEASKQKREEREQKLENLRLIGQAKLIDLAINLVPEALRPFARVEDNEYLVVAAPECATIKRRFYVSRSSDWSEELQEWLDSFTNVYFSDIDHDHTNMWRVYDWFIGKDDNDQWFAHQAPKWRDQSTSDIERALAIASEVGNNYEAIETACGDHNCLTSQEASESHPTPVQAEEAIETACGDHNCLTSQEASESHPAPVQAEEPICPIMSPGETYEHCVKNKCAWFITGGTHGCALKVIAIRASGEFEFD